MPLTCRTCHTWLVWVLPLPGKLPLMPLILLTTSCRVTPQHPTCSQRSLGAGWPLQLMPFHSRNLAACLSLQDAHGFVHCPLFGDRGELGLGWMCREAWVHSHHIPSCSSWQVIAPHGMWGRTCQSPPQEFGTPAFFFGRNEVLGLQ